MARMIPPFMDNGSVHSNGEKKLFDALCSLPDDYVIIHSLGIADHRQKVHGEIDFVIICSDGILCLEVKGGLVQRKNGIWQFTDRNGNKNTRTEGPFDQVIGGMFSLRDKLRKKFPKGSQIYKCQFACGVVFPDMPFTQEGPDIISEIVFDSRSSFVQLEDYILNTIKHWRNRLQMKYGYAGGKLNIESIKKVEIYLRGDFGFVPPLKYILDQTETNLLHLTKEQSERLSMASQNPRIILEGVAGTGKTLLSMEYARKQAISGKRVLYLCYNTTLARYLKFCEKNNNSEWKENFIINTFHSYIINESKRLGWIEDKKVKKDDNFFTVIMPEIFCDFVDQYDCDKFDTLVIDEGQDLLRIEYLMCMDHMLNGGLDDGNWHICYDPNQNLYNNEFLEGLSYIRNINHTYLTLDTNCRNTRPVGIYNTLYTGVKPARFFRVEGEGVVAEPYEDFIEERKMVVSAVRRLLGQGVNPGSIVLLSKHKFEDSCLEGKNIFKDTCSFQNIADYQPALLVDKSIKFSTVHSFKGMEAQIIFLLDVDSFFEQKVRLINYTAMSRACSLLYIFYNKKAQNEMKEMVNQSATLLQMISG